MTIHISLGSDTACGLEVYWASMPRDVSTDLSIVVNDTVSDDLLRRDPDQALRRVTCEACLMKMVEIGRKAAELAKPTALAKSMAQLDELVADWKGCREPPSADVVESARHMLTVHAPRIPTSMCLQSGGGISLRYDDICISFDNDDRGIGMMIKIKRKKD